MFQTNVVGKMHIFNIPHPQNHAVYEITWKNMIDPEWPQMIM